MVKALKITIYCILFSFFITCIETVYAQELPFRNYLEKDGLPSAVVYYVFQDSGGCLWMGTEYGLSRFDGYEFKRLKKSDGLPDHLITAIYEDKMHNLWVGTTNGGVGCFSGNRFITYPGQENLKNTNVYSIVGDNNGRLWIGTSHGLSCLDRGIYKQYSVLDKLIGDNIIAIEPEGEEKLWLGTDRGLGCFEKAEGKLTSTYTVEDNLLDNFITSLLIDSNGYIWIGTRKGLNLLKEGTLYSFTEENGLSNNIITSLFEDRDGRLWIGTWNGVTLFSNQKFHIYRTENGLPNNVIYSITQDKEGNVWFGTHGGLSLLTTPNIKNYTENNGLPDNLVLRIIQDKRKRYWIATSGGLVCHEDGAFRTYTKKDGLISDQVNQLLEDSSGNIWIGTAEGLSIFSAGSFINYTTKEGLPGNIIFELKESKDGIIWIGGNSFITCWRDGKFSPPPFELNKTKIFNILEDCRGDLWLSSRQLLYRFSNGILSTCDDHLLLKESETYIHTLFEDKKGRIWVGTEGGIGRFEGEQFMHFSAENSNLLDNSCYCFLEDDEGKIWIGHSKGLSCFNGEQFMCFTSERLGLKSRSWLRGIRDDKGEFWIATTSGVICFFLPPISVSTCSPPIYITGVKSMEKDIALKKNNEFSYNQNIFRFNFKGLSYSPPGRLNYKYMLENIDLDWRLTNDHSLFYPFLPPGNYKFKVKAVNYDGIESESAADYSFTILPPFWKTWWFIFLVGLVMLVLVLKLIQWRVKRLAEKVELKTKKAELEAKNKQLVLAQRMELLATLAAGNVHDLKNLMAVIIAYSRMMSKKYTEDQEDYKNFVIIKDSAATAVQMAKQILSFARPKASSPNELIDIGKELSEIISTLRISQPKHIHILWTEKQEAILYPIHPAHFQQVVMNLCLNACQAMPKGGNLHVALKTDAGDKIILEFTDTGQGIHEDHLAHLFEPLFTTKEPGEGTGLGLFVVKQIIDEYNGQIDIKSTPGEGTTFTISLPSKEKKTDS